MTIDDLLKDQARLRPEAVALVDDRGGTSFTFSQLESAVGCAAAWWEKRGISRGKAVLVFVPMSAELYVSLLALFRLGAVALFLDPSAGREHLERCCERWKPDALFAVSKAHLLRLRSKALRTIALKVRVGAWMPGAVAWPRRWRGASTARGTANPADPALVTFTSGSTGVPKGAVRTHAFLLAQHKALAPSLRLEAGEVDLATLPVFVFANLAAGVTTVIPAVDMRRPGAVDAKALVRQVRRRSVSRITASPAFFERLVQACDEEGVQLPQLSKLFTGGAPVFPRLLEAMARWAPRARVEAVYGSTEAEPIAHVGLPEIGTGDARAMRGGKGLLAGKPVSAIEVRVVRDQFGAPLGTIDSARFDALACAPEVAGEIVVSGDHVLQGYLGGIGDEETKFRVDGRLWHRTGDAGCFDTSGRLWLLGRCSAKLTDKGPAFYPFGAECVAMTFSEVRRAALVVREGRRVMVVEAQLGEEQELALLAALAWASVESVIQLKALPVDRRHNAKIDYPALHQLLKTRV